MVLFNGARAKVEEAQAQLENSKDGMLDEGEEQEEFQPRPNPTFNKSLEKLCPNMSKVHALCNGKGRIHVHIHTSVFEKPFRCKAS